MKKSASPTKNVVMSPFINMLPNDIWINIATTQGKSTWTEHAHPWGEFIFNITGAIEVKLGENSLTAIQNYAIWLPPNVTHECLNHKNSQHFSLYVMPSFCEFMPHTPCSLEANRLVRAIVTHIFQNPIQIPPKSADITLIHALNEQIALLPVVPNFLPQTTDCTLKKVLDYIQENPGERININELARKFGMTTKTLNRKCQRSLGMTVSDWRLRQRVLSATRLLESGEKVETVAFMMGYSTASAFIAMFHKITGKTPKHNTL